MPNRVVLDATNLTVSKIKDEEIELNSVLKLDPNGSNIDVVVQDNDEELYNFINTDGNMRLKFFKAIACKYPQPATRSEIANSVGLKQGKLTDSTFNKTYLYAPIKMLSEKLEKGTNNRLSIDTTNAASTGYLLKINL